MSTPRRTNVGDYIKNARTHQGISVQKLGRLVGVPGSTIQRIETGFTKHPSPDVLTRIANTLDLDLATVFAYAGYATTKGLPKFGGYLKSKYPNLHPDAVTEIRNAAETIAHRYGTPLRWPDQGEDEEPDD